MNYRVKLVLLFWISMLSFAAVFGNSGNGIHNKSTVDEKIKKAESYYGQNKKEKALTEINSAFPIADNLDYTEALIQLNLLKFNLTNEISLIETASELTKKLRSDIDRAQFLVNISDSYKYRDYIKSFENLQTAGNIYKKFDSINKQVILLCKILDLSVENTELLELKPIVSYANKLDSILPSQKFVVQIDGLSTISELYIALNDTIKSNHYYNKALSIAELNDEYESLGSLLFRKGILEKYKGNFSNSTRLFTMSIFALMKNITKKDIDLNEQLGMIYMARGEDYQKLKKYNQSCQDLLEAIRILESKDKFVLGVMKMSIFELLQANYDSLKNYKSSLHYYKLYKGELDSAFKREEEVKLIELEKKFKLENKNLQIENLTKDSNLQKLYTKSLMFITIIIVCFIIIIYNRFKTTKRQKIIIEKQKATVEDIHKEIKDSINYAERLQRSLMANHKVLDEFLADNYFVYLNPKEKVSGDFYWAMKLKNNHFLLACADSTGHGVPGAIMSMMNMNSLKESVNAGLTEPSDILNHSRKLIIETLKNDGSEQGGKDGMDCALLSLNPERTKLTFAAANNPVLIIRNGEVMEFKPDKMPVGKHDKDQESFSLNSVDLQKGDVIYTLTDGMPDQFGGDKGKKYMIKNLKTFLASISSLQMDTQKEKLHEEFTNWKGELEQVDDVCVMGVRI